MSKSLSLAAAAAISLLASAAVAQTTGTTGGGAAYDNRQASLVMTQLIATNGIFPCRCDDAGHQAAQATIGQIHTFAGDFGAYGQPMAQGQILPIQQNTALFAVLNGNTYGGNGQTTFALPDLTGRAIIGAGQGPGLSSYALGQTPGTDANVMSLSQLPAHDHGLPGGGVTGSTGGGAPINNVQSSLALTYQIATGGFPPGAGAPMLGQVGAFAGNFESAGWLNADGRLLSIQDYGDLFNVIGTTYGGDGQTTFALPDLQSRVVVGAGGGIALGDAFGQEQTFLTEANLPSHDHSLPGGGFTDPDGGGLAFDNEQPSLALNYLIATQGLFPTRDGGGSVPADFQFLGEVTAFAGAFAPAGWHFADGTILSISQNTALFALLGCNYGGNCQTTFALPDLRGRTILGAGGDFTVGEVLGENFHTLTVAEMAAHDHTLPDGGPGGPGVPEPATWALLIGGFGLAGAALRRRKSLV